MKKRDTLAYHRSILANERTFLAYIRTFLTFFIAGVSFIHFFRSPLIFIIGWIFALLGIGVLFIGAVRFLATRKRLGKINNG